ncbi:hypothetical protein SLA2020_100790 [Shorea laevis]
MASIPASFLLLFVSISATVSTMFSATVIEDLANLKPPPNFNATITNNCLHNPSLRYCNSTAMDLHEIFRFTIVASHLCNESKNPNCVETFSEIDLRNRPKIAPLYLSFSFFWKYCPLSILSIDLSNNSIKGSFPADVLLCTQIQALDLSHNEFSSDVPIQSFSSLSNLTLLNLSFNHFSESNLSDSEFFKRFNSSSFIHSGLLPSRKRFRLNAVILLLCFPIFVILIVGGFWWCCFQRPDFLPRMCRRRHRFTASMLKAATDEFSKKNLMGKSDGIAIYRGILRDGFKVRIEIYWKNISRENLRNFAEECKVVVQLCHKNLLRVYGWCNDRRLRAIVAEWTEENSVEIWISGSAPPWKQRLKVLKGVAEGMLYLEEQWPDIGYDLRTSSVLLSDNQEPLISRFKVGDRSNITNKIRLFGLFLLEIMTNTKPLEGFEERFVEFIRVHYTGNLQAVIDERMKMTENTFDQAKQAIEIGLMCTNQTRSHQQPSLYEMVNIMTRMLASQNHKRSSHCEGGRAHRGII